jgi:hypothetical protein
MNDATPAPEIWRPIPGHEDHYEVSSYGNVRSIDRVVHVHTAKGCEDRRYRGRPITPQLPQGHTHWQVQLWRRTVGSVCYVHLLVLEAFVGPRPPGLVGCHRDDNPNNNHVSNLRWDTRRENLLDAVRNGTHYWAMKKSCPRGHELVLPNLVASTLRKGRRDCLACSRARGSARTAARRGVELDFVPLAHEQYARIMVGSDAA